MGQRLTPSHPAQGLLCIPHSHLSEEANRKEVGVARTGRDRSPVGTEQGPGLAGRVSPWRWVQGPGQAVPTQLSGGSAGEQLGAARVEKGRLRPRLPACPTESRVAEGGCLGFPAPVLPCQPYLALRLQGPESQELRGSRDPVSVPPAFDSWGAHSLWRPRWGAPARD